MSTPRHPEYQYLDLMQEILDKGERQVDKDHGTATYSLFGRQTRYDLADGFPLLTTKKVYWKGILHELYWFLSGKSNIKYLVDNDVHIWDDYPYKIYKEKTGEEIRTEDFVAKRKADPVFAEAHGNLPHIYGEMWRRWRGEDGRTVDQVQWIVDEIRKDRDAHNTLVTSWNPEYLYSMAKPGEGARFPICHNMYQINIKEGRLCLQLYQRSADIFLGVPFNIGSYALLTVILAQVTGYKPGEFIHTFGDVHIYETHMEQAKEQLSREPKPFPKLSLDPSVKEIDDFKPEHVTLTDYDAHPPIKAELVVSGGYNKKIHAS